MKRPAPTALKLAILHSGSYQKDVAAAAGLDPATFSRIVNGLWCDSETRQRIAEALGRSVAELWPEHEAASNVPMAPGATSSATDREAA